MIELLKNILKAFKLNESSISMFLGAVVIVVVGILLVNYFRGLDTGNTFPEGLMTESQPGETVTNEDGTVTYTVKEGDTLWTISEEQYETGHNWEMIAEANSIDNPNDIEEGQALTIPQAESDSLAMQKVTMDENESMEMSEETVETSEKEVSQDLSQPETLSGDTYTVVKGDTLWDIAVRRYGDGHMWVEIAEVNDLANPDLIHPGNVFQLP